MSFNFYSIHVDEPMISLRLGSPLKSSASRSQSHLVVCCHTRESGEKGLHSCYHCVLFPMCWQMLDVMLSCWVVLLFFESLFQVHSAMYMRHVHECLKLAKLAVWNVCQFNTFLFVFIADATRLWVTPSLLVCVYCYNTDNRYYLAYLYLFVIGNFMSGICLLLW